MTTAPSNTRPVPPSRWSRLRRLMLQGIVGAVIAAAGVAIVAIILGAFSTLLAKLLVIAVVFTLFAAFTAIDTGLASRNERLALAGVIINIYLLLEGVIKTAIAGPGGAAPDTGTAVFLAFAGWIWLTVIARLALLLARGVLLQRRMWRFGNVNTLTGITMALVGLLALQLSLPLIFSTSEYPAVYWRATGVAAVLVGLGVALTPLVGRLFGERVPRYPAVVEPQPWHQPASGQQTVATGQASQITPVDRLQTPVPAPDTDVR